MSIAYGKTTEIRGNNWHDLWSDYLRSWQRHPVRLIAALHACGVSVRNERRGHDPFFSLSNVEMHRDKWRIHIQDSIADASLLQYCHDPHNLRAQWALIFTFIYNKHLYKTWRHTLLSLFNQPHTVTI